MVSDRIASVKVSLVILPLQKPASDAKVLTGKQKPLSEVAFLFAELQSEEGHEGVGYSYALRAGAPALYAHARELAPALIGENPSDIQRIWSKLAWLGQSVGRSGVTAQAVAAFDVALWDLKAKRARLPLAQLLGAHRDSVPCYNTSGGYLSTPIDELITNAQASLAAGIGGIKIKVGQPDRSLDLSRVAAVRSALGEDVPADGRCQPAVEPHHRNPHGPRP
jgi:L-alanine-DL-glutamate epimerase-like enolase superfamily enzyme